MAVCIYLDWILGGPVNVICIVHSSDRMIGPVPPCQQSCYRHAFKVSEKEKNNWDSSPLLTSIFSSLLNNIQWTLLAGIFQSFPVWLFIIHGGGEKGIFQWFSANSYSIQWRLQPHWVLISNIFSHWSLAVLADIGQTYQKLVTWLTFSIWLISFQIHASPRRKMVQNGQNMTKEKVPRFLVSSKNFPFPVHWMSWSR